MHTCVYIYIYIYNIQTICNVRAQVMWTMELQKLEASGFI